MASTRVVLPWSTWATMAMFRRSERTDTQKHSLQVGAKELGGNPASVVAQKCGVALPAGAEARERYRFGGSLQGIGERVRRSGASGKPAVVIHHQLFRAYVGNLG